MLTNVNTASTTSPSFDNFTKDGKITNSEKKAIISWINSQQTFKPEEKQQLATFVNQLNKSTTSLGTFLGFIPNKKISPENLAKLESMAGTNSFASSLLQDIKTAQAQSSLPRNNTDTSSTENRPSSKLPANFMNFPTLNRTSNNSNNATPAGLVAESKFMPISNKDNYLVDQFSTSLNSSQGDCGPTSALMILRANGFNTNVDAGDAIRKMRKETNSPSADSKGKVAISFSQMEAMVKKESGGAIKASSPKSYAPSNVNELVADLKNQLKEGKMPVLLTAGTRYQDLPEDKKALYDKYYAEHPNEKYIPAEGHYRVVIGVNEDNSIIFADPSGGRVTTVSIEELQAQMEYRASNKNYLGNKKESRETTVMSFSRE